MTVETCSVTSHRWWARHMFTFSLCRFSILQMRLPCSWRTLKFRQRCPSSSIFSMFCWCKLIAVRVYRTPSLCSALCATQAGSFQLEVSLFCWYLPIAYTFRSSSTVIVTILLRTNLAIVANGYKMGRA